MFPDRHLGFQVIRGSNLGRQGMIDKLAELSARLEVNDTAALFRWREAMSSAESFGREEFLNII